MAFSKKIKKIVNKIDQNKTQCNSDRQNDNISALSSGNVGKHEFLMSEDISSEKERLEKVATIKRFEYRELKVLR